jgi:hypothetical protein
VSAKNLTDNTANSLSSHVASCSKCPEPIKASLAYLSHRASLQKADLSGTWKKTFYKLVWDRLHVERAWTSGEEDGKEDESEASSSEEEEEEEEVPQDEGVGEESDSGGEDTGGMSKLIKAAAVWLSEQDQDTSRSRVARGRGLPGRARPLPVVSPSAAGGGSASKRRRVHF